MAHKDSISETESEPKVPLVAPNHSRIKLMIIVATIALLFGAGTCCVYFWQHSKLTTSEKSVNTLNRTNIQLQSELKTSKSSYKSLENKYKIDQAQLASSSVKKVLPPPPLSQADLNLTINQVEWMNPAGQVTQGASWFGIRMTLTNSTTGSIDVTPGDFQLEDADSNYYQQEGFQNGDTFPQGWGTSTLQSQTLLPGQTVVGDIMFPMPNKNITTFTLLNGTKQYTVAANNN